MTASVVNSNSCILTAHRRRAVAPGVHPALLVVYIRGLRLRAEVGQDVTTNEMEVVSMLESILADRVGQDRFDLWFGPGAKLVPRDGVLTVVTPNRFVRDWLRSNFSADLEASCEEAFGRPMTLEFQVDKSMASVAGLEDASAAVAVAPEAPCVDRAAPCRVPASPKRPAARPIATAETERNPPASPQTAQLGLASSSADSLASHELRIVGPDERAAESRPARAATPEAVRAGSGPTGPVSLEPPARPRRRLHTLETFVVGDSNCVAVKTVEMALQRPGAYSPLVLYGPTGVGKTHLLESLLVAFRQERRGTAVYISAEQFTSQFLEALHGSGLPSFRRKYRNLGLLAIDDIQFFAGKKVTLTELQHTLDTLLRSGAQLVLAADRSPAAIKSLGPELIARLQGGAACRIEPAEYATRLGIVSRLAGELGIEAPPDALAYIAQRLTSQSRELAGALKRLHASSLAHNRPISRALAEEALAELVHQTGRSVRLADIERAVCEVFGLETSSLQAGGKTKAVSHPRMLAMWLARKHTRSALSEIGQYFGRRSHSTVISAQKKVDHWISKGESLSLADRAWTLEEAVRRVEEQMRAG